MSNPMQRLMEQVERAERRIAAHSNEFRANLRSMETGGDRLGIDTRERVTSRINRAARMVASPSEPAADALALERILGKSDLLNINFFEIGLLRARPVGRVVIRQGASIVGFGTGFLISPRLLLTNHHVLSTASEAAGSTIEFDFALGPDGQPRTVAAFQLKPAEFFHAEETLDYACVAVATGNDSGIQLEAFGFLQVVEETGKVIEGESLNIVQHPGGEMKQLACRENDLINVLDDVLLYRTDTAPGSSGSPVFSDMWELVGLHHAGQPKRNGQGQILAIDGTVWTPGMGEHRIAWIANEGIRISRIASRLKALSGLTAAQASLRDGIFSSTAPVPVPPAERDVQSTSGRTQPAVSADGTVTWTIPVQLSVQIGAAIRPQAVPSAAPVLPAPTVPPPSNGTPSARDQDMQAALSQLDRSEALPYYDEAADVSARNAYYGGIEPCNSGAAAFYGKLHDLLERTHTTKPKYKPAVHLYPLIDLQPPSEGSKKLRSIYTGQLFSAQTFIEADFQAEAMRERLMAAGLEAATLEAAAPFNCEHTVPQSWFAEKEPMRGDLHHLFACESKCNSFRGNTPFFDFPDFEEALREGCGRNDGGQAQNAKFEPNQGKGEVARATLYFLIRYPGKAARLPSDRIQILLDWHQRFPVTLHDLHRNQAIFAAQGNRNPLIDHPDWAQRIDFTLGLAA